MDQKGIGTIKQKETVFTKLANVIQEAANELEKADPNYFMLLNMLGGEAVQEVNPATGERATVFPLNRPAKQREELLKVAKAAYAMGLAARYICSGEDAIKKLEREAGKLSREAMAKAKW